MKTLGSFKKELAHRKANLIGPFRALSHLESESNILLPYRGSFINDRSILRFCILLTNYKVKSVEKDFLWHQNFV